MDDDLKALLKDETPLRPDPERRRQAITGAMARFAQENPRHAQGSAEGARQSSWRGATLKALKGLTHMHTFRLNHALMAGASLAALGFVALNVGWLDRAPRLEQTAELPKDVKIEAPEIGRLQKTKPIAKELRLNEAETLTADVDAYIAQPSPATEGKTDTARLDGAIAIAEGDADVRQPGYSDQGRDKFTDIVPNPVKQVGAEPVSTFSIDVDTASYSFVRSALMNNTLPQKDAVRVEELINYFPYDYTGPANAEQPFKATATVMPTPWNAKTELLHIGIKGFTLNGQQRPRSNLVFLLDTSGSMNETNKLPLLVNSLKLLVDTLGADDTVSIVTYAGNAGTVLAPTKAADKAAILAALDRLEAGGSTAGAEGIRQAYALAEQSFDRTGVNRVILATDGDFNVGITDPEELKSFVERKRTSGVYLSVLGFGRGNYNDEMMQTLAQNGNGNAAYIDTLNEARKVLVDEAFSTLFPIAKDVKIQVEFNPQTVSEYRLIGYETRLLAREDFNNDKVDAGEIGSGHTVTAIYEYTRKGTPGLIDPLRFGEKQAEGAASGAIAEIKLRFKLPGSDTSTLVSQVVEPPSPTKDVLVSPEARFASAVAAFGQILRGGQYTGSFGYDDVIALAEGAKGKDSYGYRAEFVNLVRLAKSAPAMETLKP